MVEKNSCKFNKCEDVDFFFLRLNQLLLDPITGKILKKAILNPNMECSIKDQIISETSLNSEYLKVNQHNIIYVDLVNKIIELFTEYCYKGNYIVGGQEELIEYEAENYDQNNYFDTIIIGSDETMNNFSVNSNQYKLERRARIEELEIIKTENSNLNIDLDFLKEGEGKVFLDKLNELEFDRNKLDFCYHSLPYKAVEFLTICHFPNLEVINFYNCNLSDISVKKIYEINLLNIKELTLAKNGLTDTTLLFTGKKKFWKLTKLLLQQNQFTDIGINYLENLHSPNLELLSLDYNKIGISGVRRFLEFNDKFTNLKVLNLQGNGIKDKDIKDLGKGHLFENFKEKFKKFERVLIS